ncbi:MAG TPA: hypothetical protein DCG19_12220 [Cryomorphaceae bacterium]|nr:hypothetical protein [Cryomorphaceae bacterium]
MNFSFSNLKGISIFFAVCVLISVIPPGLLFIHMFIPDLASTYNFGYVLILSISIAGPPWLINSFLSTLVSSEDNNSQRNSDQKKDEKEDKEEEDDDISETAGMGAVFGSLYNLVLFYILTRY